MRKSVLLSSCFAAAASQAKEVARALASSTGIDMIDTDCAGSGTTIRLSAALFADDR